MEIVPKIAVRIIGSKFKSNKLHGSTSSLRSYISVDPCRSSDIRDPNIFRILAAIKNFIVSFYQFWCGKRRAVTWNPPNVSDIWDFQAMTKVVYFPLLKKGVSLIIIIFFCKKILDCLELFDLHLIWWKFNWVWLKYVLLNRLKVLAFR